MSQHFSSEQLNFFKFSAIVLNEFPKALRQVFKAMWDNRYVIPNWDDSVMVRNMFQHHEGGNMTHVPTDKSYMEWDCTALFQATLYARSFVQSGGRKRETNLYDLYVKPRRLKDGAFHHSVWTQTRNNEETLALALDQLRLLRNALFHQTNTQSIDSSTFHNYLVSAKDAFDALGLSFESVENFLKGAVLDFHASKIKELLHKEKNAAIKSKQFENYLSEIKASCNTRATDHGGPKLENNCRFFGSKAKSSAVDGKTKVVKQAQKFHDSAQTAVNSSRCSFQEAHLSSGYTYNRINDKLLEAHGILSSRNRCERFVGKLDKALNFRQSEHISEARNEVHELFDLIKREDARDFRKPTPYCLEVVSRGSDLFFDESVSFSLKHGLLVLDSSNGGALFYASLLNVLAVLALETSEFHIAREIFSILVAFHSTSDATSRLRDMAAAFNNRGCLSLIVGELNHAKSDFDNSVRHLNCEKHKQQSSSSIEAMIIGVHNNICRLHFMSRSFTKCLEEQNELLALCKSKVPELPMQTVFMVLHNQAKSNTALGNMARAEMELKWLNSYCKTLPKRERHDLLLDFVSLQLCEVLLLSGKPEEANSVYPFERLTSECVLELMPLLGGIYFDLMIETFEKRIDVLLQVGKRKNALEFLQKQIILVKEQFGVKHFFVSSLLYKEGCTLKLEGKLSDAWEKFKCSSEILRDIFGEQHPLLIKCYMSLGGVSLRLGRESESHLSFQRAMENVEVIHQVSFLNQLSIRYIEMTSNPKRNPFGMFQKRDVVEQMIDGLVAELGLALAVLLSPLNSKKEQSLSETTKKGEKPLPRKIAKATRSEIVLIVSQKIGRDLLLNGQTFLRLGMKNEAGIFFQLAGELCETNYLVQGQSRPPLVSLFNFISQTNFAKQNKVIENSDLIRFLQELKKDAVNSANEFQAESKTEVGEKLNLDSQMDLKLVLILLIFFSVQLQLHDSIFAAYDLYASLFPNDGWFFLSANDELQVYSSRTSVTCNGKTAVQHVLFSTATGDSRSELESFIPRNSVFRNVVYRKGVPTYSLLAIHSSDAIPDVDDIKQVEQATLRSFQEYLEIKCLDDEGDATQFIVDLSPISEKESFLTERRVELLPLCLSQEKVKAGLPNERRNVHSIVSFLCEKTAWVRFADETTTCFMFGKIALWLLQECKWKTMSSLRVQNQCLVLTMLLPVKAKITLWYENYFIKQRVQIIFTDDGEQLLRGTEQKDSLCKTGGYNKIIEEFFAPVIHHWTNGDRKGTAITRECLWAAAPTAALHESNERASFQRPFKEERSARKCLNAITLECLTAVSELTYLLHGNQHPDGAVPDVHPEDASKGVQTNEVVPKVTETDPSFSFFDSDVSSLKVDKDVTPDSRGSATISSYCHKTASISEGNTEEINDLLLTPSGSSNAEGSNSVAVTDEDRLLGRELFVKDRKSRHFSIAKLLEEMKKKEILPNPCLLVKSESHTKEECVKEVSSVEESFHQKLHCERLRSGSFDCSEHEGEEDGNKNFEDNDSFSERCRSSLAFCQKHAPVILQTSEERKEERGWVFPSAAELQNGSVCQSVIDEKEKQSATTSTIMEVALLRKKNGDHFCVSEENEANIKEVCGQQSDQHVVLEGATEERGMDISDPQIGRVERNHAEHNKNNKEVMQLEKENDLHIGMFKSHDSQNQKKTSLLGSETNSESSKISEIGECFLERAEDAVQNTSRDFESFNLGLTISRRKQSHDKVDVSGQIGTKLQLDQRDHLSGVSAIHRKHHMKRTPRSPFFGGDVVADGFISDVLPDSTTVAVLPTLQLSEVQQGDTMGANTHSRFLGDDVVADAYGYLTAALPQTFQDIVDGPAITTENPHSGDATIEERGTGNVCCGEIRGNDVKEVNKLSRIYNNCSDQVTLDRRVLVDTSANPPADRDDADYHPPDFGGARRKQGLPKPPRSSKKQSEEILGLNPNFVARHAVTDDTLHYPDFDGAEWKDPLYQYSEEHLYLANVSGNLSRKKSFNLYGQEVLQNSHNSSSISRQSPESDAFDGGATMQRSVHSLARSPSLLPKEDKSWHFPPLQGTTENHIQQRKYRENYGPGHLQLTQDHGPMFQSPNPDASNGTVVASTNFNNNTDSYGDSSLHSTYTSKADSVTVHEDQRDLIEDNIETRLEDLEKVMSRTVGLFASIDATETQVEIKEQSTEKVGIQEQAMSGVDNGQTEIAGGVYSGEQTSLIPRNEQTTDTKSEDSISPIQESPRPACGHYQRRCLVRFPCCGRFYPCHRCHNESAACTDDQARAINATHIRCIICYHEQVIDEGSQKCRGCNSKISDYFCAICKHFTSLDKNPFHCDKCGICRIHRDKSFHCDVCNVCLDKRLQGKHKCRPDSGHDECCICLEDAFSGCQILPCSHKVHKDCAIAMIQNGIRTCPICRHPLFQQPEGTDQ